MAEREPSDLDLADAFRAYLEDAPTQVRPTELARHFATAYPRGKTLLGAWRPIAVAHPPAVVRFAWLPLLVAGLLLAMLGGMLIVASQAKRDPRVVLPPVGELFTCPPGSTPDEPGPVDQARPFGGGATPAMAFDRAAGKIVMLEGAGTWTFDVCSNTWTQMQSGSGPDTGLELAYDPRADLTIGVDVGEDRGVAAAHAWAYDLDANTWTSRGPAPDNVVWLGYDSASGQIVAWAAEGSNEPGTIWTYDVDSDTWAPVGALEALGGFLWGHPVDLLAYDASVDRVVATVSHEDLVPGERTRLFDVRTGRMVDAQAPRPQAALDCYYMIRLYCDYGDYGSKPAGIAITYDERSERVVVLIAGHMFAYDAGADRWDTLSGDPGLGAPGRQGSSMVYDPVNQRLVVYTGELSGDDVSGDAVLAFDTMTREWTLLVEPGEGQPAPSPES
jgi:hypothetical protein